MWNAMKVQKTRAFSAHFHELSRYVMLALMGFSFSGFWGMCEEKPDLPEADAGDTSGGNGGDWVGSSGGGGSGSIADDPVTGSDTVSGHVSDPFTGAPVAGATVSIAIDPVGGGTYTSTTTTNAQGDYSFNDVPDGTGAVEVTIGGETSSLDVDTTNTSTSANNNFSPPPPSYGSGKYVIVLSWGQSPYDLDSHLWVPTSSPTHVYYAALGDHDGILDTAPFAGLDHDDVDGVGPETMTIDVPNVANGYAHYAGNYRYWVYKYSGSGNELTASNARVMVYLDNALIKTYDVPTTGSGRYWHVFDLNNATITDVNVIQTSQPTSL